MEIITTLKNIYYLLDDEYCEHVTLTTLFQFIIINCALYRITIEKELVMFMYEIMDKYPNSTIFTNNVSQILDIIKDAEKV